MVQTRKMICLTIQPGGKSQVSAFHTARHCSPKHRAKTLGTMIWACNSPRNIALTAILSSTNSVDDFLNGDDAELAPDAWKANLHERIEQIVDRKRSSTEGRAESLNGFAHILMARFAKDDVESRVSELVPSILKSIRAETTERETVNALKGKPSYAVGELVTVLTML